MNAAGWMHGCDILDLYVCLHTCMYACMYDELCGGEWERKKE